MTESPAWLGDLEGTRAGAPPDGGGPVEWREAVPPPSDPLPLWPAGTLDPPAAAPAPPAVQAAVQAAVETAGLGVVTVTNRRQVRPPPSPTRPRRSRRRARRPRQPAVGLVALIACALASAFFAWVSAEPLWLAVGHAQPGTVTVLACDAGRCIGTFTGGDVTRTGVPVMGRVPPSGASAPARMTSARGCRAYVDTNHAGPAAAGLLALLLCGLGTARVTGTRRLVTRRERRLATGLCLAAPFALLVAMLAVTF